MIKTFENFEPEFNKNKKIDFYYLSTDISTTKIREVYNTIKNKEYRAVATFCSNISAFSDVPFTKISLINYPITRSTKNMLLREIEQSVKNNADEIEFPWQEKYMAWNIETWRTILSNTASKGVILRPMLETQIMTNDAIKEAISFFKNIGIYTITTSTGLIPETMTFERYKEIKTFLPTQFIIKACGDINDLETSNKFFKSGIDLVGTSKILS